MPDSLAAPPMLPSAAHTAAEYAGWGTTILLGAGMLTGTTRKVIRAVVLWACEIDVRARNEQAKRLEDAVATMARTADEGRREVSRGIGEAVQEIAAVARAVEKIADEQIHHGQDIASLLTAADITPRRRVGDRVRP